MQYLSVELASEKCDLHKHLVVSLIFEVNYLYSSLLAKHEIQPSMYFVRQSEHVKWQSKWIHIFELLEISGSS